MSETERVYTVRELARVAGITVRTLHHYDDIGLLKPALRTAAGYRVYGRVELERLQVILFYRELDVPLSEIAAAIAGNDRLWTLQKHRSAIGARLKRLKTLIRTIDQSIQEIKGGDMLDDKELYKGFTPDQIETYQTEASNRWPEQFKQVNGKIRRMTTQQWRAVREEGEETNRLLSDAMGGGLAPDSDEVQKLVSRHHRWIENFYPCGAEQYSGLAQMYVSDERFAAHYDTYGDGLASYLSTAMKTFAAARLR